MTNNPLNQQQIDSMNRLIDKIAKHQIQFFGKISSEPKADGTLITECDRWSDKEIVKGINIIAPGEGVLSEEGSKVKPDSAAYWVVDPLDGTTNFAAGIPYWAISIARFNNGKPDVAFLEIPALKKRILAIKGKGAWLNEEKISKDTKDRSQSDCISLCSRSIRVLQKQPSKRFPGKIRLLGVSSLNMLSVALGQTISALEATPKIWDLAASWLILSELNCSIHWLERDPGQLNAGEDLTSVNFPLIVGRSPTEVKELLPWGNVLIEN